MIATNMPRVSIITPCYNAEPYIGATIESVQAQTFTDWEHIVVDDGSTDGSAQAVQRYLATEPRLRLVQQPNKGMSGARNSGYSASSPESDYVIFFDADDEMEPEMLATMVNYLDAHPDVGLVHCKARFIDSKGQIIEEHPEQKWVPRYAPTPLGLRVIPDEEAETPFCALLVPATIITPVVLLRKCIYEQTPGSDETFDYYGETDVFLQMALRSKAHFLALPLVRYRWHSGQSSSLEKREHNMRQEARLFAKWRQIEGLTPEQRRMVREAFWFLDTRVLPYRGLHAGLWHLKRGEIGPAARFLGGAAKRYLQGLLRRP